MLPELRLRGGGEHRGERKASCSSPPGQKLRCSRPLEIGRTLGRLIARGSGWKGLQRGAKNTFHEYAIDLLRTTLQPIIALWAVTVEMT